MVRCISYYVVLYRIYWGIRYYLMAEDAALRFFGTLSYMKIGILYPKLRLKALYTSKSEKIMAYRYVSLASSNMPPSNIVMAICKWPESCRTTGLSPKSSPKTCEAGYYIIRFLLKILLKIAIR